MTDQGKAIECTDCKRLRNEAGCHGWMDCMNYMRDQLTELRAALSRIADHAHDTDDDSHEKRSVRLGECCQMAFYALHPEMRRPTPEPGELVGGKLGVRLDRDPRDGQLYYRTEADWAAVKALTEQTPPVPAETAGETDHDAPMDVEFGCDPGDSVALEKLRMAIDDNLLWTSDEASEAGDYEACVRYSGELARKGKNFDATVEHLQSALTRAEGRVRELESALRGLTGRACDGCGEPVHKCACEVGPHDRAKALLAQPPLASSVVADEATTGEGKDSCEFCLGGKGGTPGNENRVGDVVVCDYCTSLLLRANYSGRAQAGEDQTSTPVEPRDCEGADARKPGPVVTSTGGGGAVGPLTGEEGKAERVDPGAWDDGELLLNAYDCARDESYKLALEYVIRWCRVQEKQAAKERGTPVANAQETAAEAGKPSNR